MYADHHAQPTRFNPGGLTAAVAINAGLIAALMFAGPTILPHDPVRTLITTNIPIDPPPPEPPKPLPKTEKFVANRPTETIVAPDPIIPSPSTSDLVTTTTILPPAPPTPFIGTDPGPVVIPTPTPLPPLIAPRIDPRYASAFQPTYPPAERRANRDGKVTVRVLVGTDGRVRQIERLTATSDAFWQVTQERALRAWRFTPATRGDVPVEAWRTMTLTFRMEDAG